MTSATFTKRLTQWLACLALILAFETQAKAESQPAKWGDVACDTQTPGQRCMMRTRRKHRRDFRPIGAFRLMYFGNGDAVPITSSFGMSFELKLFQPAVIEGGVSFYDYDYSIFVNAGYSFELVQARSRQGGGVEVRLATLLGYKWMHVDQLAGVDEFHGITVNANLELNIWFNRRIGLQFQLGGGFGIWVAASNTSVPPLFPELRIAIGILF